MKTFEEECHDQIGSPAVVDVMATGLVDGFSFQ
jgi:hypothetical protein